MFQEHHIIELLERIERQNEHIAHQNERIELQNAQLAVKDEQLIHLERDTLKLELDILRQLKRLQPPPILSTSISFKETSMNPTAAGQTQVFTGTLAPAGSILAPDAVATVTSNDPAVTPTLDPTNLIVSVTYPDGWVESTTTPLAFAYATTSASTGQALSATITPSAPPPPPPVLATSIAFAQTT